LLLHELTLEHELAARDPIVGAEFLPDPIDIHLEWRAYAGGKLDTPMLGHGRRSLGSSDRIAQSTRAPRSRVKPRSTPSSTKPAARAVASIGSLSGSVRICRRSRGVLSRSHLLASLSARDASPRPRACGASHIPSSARKWR